MDTQSSIEKLKSIIQPHAEDIAICHMATRNMHGSAIVFVVHKPGSIAMEALRVLGCADPLPPPVFAMPCKQASQAFAMLPATSAWLKSPAKKEQIKIFLIAGNGTALLTLNISDEGLRVDVESQTGDLN